jgi:hypothetical protein
MAAWPNRQRRGACEGKNSDHGLYFGKQIADDILISEAELLIEHIRGKSAGTIDSNDDRTDEGTWAAPYDSEECNELPARFHDVLPSSSQGNARNQNLKDGARFERDPDLELASRSRRPTPGMKHANASDGVEEYFTSWIHGGGSSRDFVELEDEPFLMGMLGCSSNAALHDPSPCDYDERQSNGVHSRWQTLYARDAVRRLVL